MTNHYYTHEYADLDSSLVENVWYDEQEQVAYVDLNDSIYKYSNVPFSAVEALVQAPSIGREFNGSLFGSKGFKRTYGPSEFVGDFYSFEDSLSERELATAGAAAQTWAPGGVVSAPTNTTTGYPGVVPKNLTVNPNASSTGKTVPLKPAVEATNAALEAQKPKGSYTVHFESDYSGSKTYTVESTSVDAAVAELKDVTERLGLRVKVTGVFVHLG